MAGDDIFHGDIVVVDEARLPRDGDITVFHVSGWLDESGEVSSGWVVKRLRHSQHGGWILESSNPAYAPRVMQPENYPIARGVVVGVITSAPGGGLQARRIEGRPGAAVSPDGRSWFMTVSADPDADTWTTADECPGPLP